MDHETNLQEFIDEYLSAARAEGYAEISEWDQQTAIRDCTHFFRLNETYFPYLVAKYRRYSCSAVAGFHFLLSRCSSNGTAYPWKDWDAPYSFHLNRMARTYGLPFKTPPPDLPIGSGYNGWPQAEQWPVQTLLHEQRKPFEDIHYPSKAMLRSMQIKKLFPLIE